MKRCSNCLLEKQVTEFNISKQGTDGFHNYCKACASAYYKAYNASRKDAEQSVWLDSKTCRKCGATKPISQFGLKSNLPDKHNIYCKPCNRELSYRSLKRMKSRA
jgi:RNase P subunit RPR2